MKVYADNAATTKMSKAARDVMVEYIDSYYGNSFKPVRNRSDSRC